MIVINMVFVIYCLSYLLSQSMIVFAIVVKPWIGLPPTL